VCGQLSSLAHDGYQHLDDLRWRADPSSRVNLDHLVIGPGGVFVVDAKNWSGRIEVRAGLVVQDGIPRDDRMIALQYLAGRVEEVLASAGFAHRPQAVACFTSDQPSIPPAVGRILLTDLRGLPRLLGSRPPVLSSAQITTMTELLAYAFPPYDVDPQELAEAEGLLFPDSQTRHAGLDAALRRPLAEWMVWLHPEQAAAARRSFNGPARIRGAAGTGKTSVALHRIAWLASTRPGRFLVTSFVRTLPPALKSSYEHLSPGTADRVDFLHVHGVALELLRQRGRRVAPSNGNAAFNAAWRQRGDQLRDLGLSREYFREEIDHVLKGRDVPDLQTYLTLERVGRRTPLRTAARERVWALRDSYDSELALRQEHDFVDILRMARDEVRSVPCRTWTGVAVDEVQDLPLVGLQFLYELAGRERPDGLLLIGDGQQAIYPGGFRLTEAGVSVAGRAVVLHTNYRNTVEILATARAVVAQDGYDDLDVTATAGDRPVDVVRHGVLPVSASYESLQEHDAALLWDLQALADRDVPWAQMAILCQTNRMAQAYADLLAESGIPGVLLKSSRSTEADAVRVGTWFRSKGMEFPHVFLPQADQVSMLFTGGGAEARQEKEELMRRTMYVAMTRARDTLWVGRLQFSAGRPVS
jgi:hypothetical protein